jgi:hypothetical protein
VNKLIIQLSKNVMHNNKIHNINNESRDSSVVIVTGYGLDDRMTGVRFPAGAGNVSFRHHVQTGSETYPAPYPMVTVGSFPGSLRVKRPGA